MYWVSGKLLWWDNCTLIGNEVRDVRVMSLLEGGSQDAWFSVFVYHVRAFRFFCSTSEFNGSDRHGTGITCNGLSC